MMHPIVSQAAWPHAAAPRSRRPRSCSAFRFLPRRIECYGFILHQHGLVEWRAIARGAGTAAIGDRVVPWRAPAAFLIGTGLVHTWTSDPRAVPPPHHSVVLQWPPGLLHRLSGVPEAAAACSHAVGFNGNGLAHFNRVFRRIHGCTPQAWRRAAMPD
jgi:AraC-like DNA-binding protein